MSGPRFEAINQEKEEENRIQYIIITIETQHDNGVRDGPIYLFSEYISHNHYSDCPQHWINVAWDI